MYYKRLSQAEIDGQKGRSPQLVIAASELHALRQTEAAGAMAEVKTADGSGAGASFLQWL